MVKTAEPPVGHRCRRDIRWLAAPHPRVELLPTRLVTWQPFGQLDHRGPQDLVAFIDESGIGLSFSAGGVAGCHAAIAGQLFPGTEAIEAAHDRPQNHRRHQPDPGLLQQLFDDCISLRGFDQPLLQAFQILIELTEPAEFLA